MTTREATERVVGLTRTGREVRRIDGGEEDGLYIAQPPNDNYWAKFTTIEAAMRFARGLRVAAKYRVEGRD